jgi:hypothetical protein
LRKKLGTVSKDSDMILIVCVSKFACVCVVAKTGKRRPA